MSNENESVPVTQLKVYSKEGTLISTLELKDASYVIGRGEDCDIQCEGAANVSRHHAELTIRDGEAFDLPDYVYDRHTIEGQRLGRGIEHFLTESAKVAPEADLGPDEALWRQAMEQELAERMKEEGEE